MWNFLPPQSDLFGLNKKWAKEHPGLSDWKNTQKNEQEELKKSLQIREKIRAEYIRSIRENLQAQNFSGKLSIQVIPGKDDTTVIYMESKDARIQIDLHYDESYESSDSLRKSTPTYPIDISITGMIEWEFYTVDNIDINNVASIWGEILKHIERKKNPKIFWYDSIEYMIKKTLDNEWNKIDEISIIWKRPNGKIEKIPFFENLDVEQREMLYWYLVHYFWAKLPSEFFQQNRKPTQPKNKDWMKEA